MKTHPTLCPSAPLEPGVVLVGVVLTNGRVAYAADRIELGEEFVAAVTQADSPERMFRFASPCRQTGCQQWTGTQCGVIDLFLEANAHIKAEKELPQCSIRPQCRWFNQEGEIACALCPHIITDSRPRASEPGG
jgi:hypothetical protein